MTPPLIESIRAPIDHIPIQPTSSPFVSARTVKRSAIAGTVAAAFVGFIFAFPVAAIALLVMTLAVIASDKLAARLNANDDA